MSRGRRDDDESFEDTERPRQRSRRDPPDDEQERVRDRPAPRRSRPPQDFDDDYYDDDYDDDRPRRRRQRSRLIPKNGLALAGYYLGFASLIVILGSMAVWMYTVPQALQNPMIFVILIFGVGGLLGLLAVVFGILGLVRANRNPQGGGTAHSVVALVLGVLVIVGLIALLLIGWFSLRGL
jgi:hypothetical protein